MRTWGRWALSGLLGLALLQPVAAQPRRLDRPERYWVAFGDKDGVRFNPAHYFSPEAQARRQRQHLPACEASDLPVRADYVAAVRARVDTVTVVSRWFNAVACRATPAQAEAIEAAHARLTDPARRGMGSLFKVLCISHPSLGALPPFPETG